ncbi:hypothetical protein [Bosea sp. F3-2]|uniref:hypothetical protein n=1 Tax=Bosea sp. F3-2 TaxID=2599640 RepID=UPI0020C09C5A|nr:hypothetical protein [Bosea sp. F3-2]
MSAEPLQDTDPATEIECEINDLFDEHGSERAVLRALLHDFHVLLADADRSVSPRMRSSPKKSMSPATAAAAAATMAAPRSHLPAVAQPSARVHQKPISAS